MRMMKKAAVLLLALLALSATAGAQEYSSDPYNFILAKLAANDGRFDEALAAIDKLTAHQPQNPVLIYERALILLDRGDWAAREHIYDGGVQRSGGESGDAAAGDQEPRGCGD